MHLGMCGSASCLARPWTRVWLCSPLLSWWPSLQLSPVFCIFFLHILCCSAVRSLLCSRVSSAGCRVRQKGMKQTPWRQQGTSLPPRDFVWGAFSCCFHWWAVAQHPDLKGRVWWLLNVTFKARQNSCLRAEYGFTTATGATAVVLL